jgi:uncharacterized membrane protein YesL
MGDFFNIDGKFYKYSTYIGDVLIVAIMWAIATLPVVTFGAATTAFYYVTTRQLSDHEGYVTHDFVKSFKSNFIEATIVTLIYLFMLGCVNFTLTHTDKSSIMFWAQFIVLYEIFITGLWIFPVLSRFELKLGELFKKSFQLANMHLPTTLTLTALFAAIMWLSYKKPLLIVMLAGVYAVLSSMIFMRVFKKYIPDMDEDEEEDDFVSVDDLDEINRDIF